MRIIDADTHISPLGQANCITADELIRRLDYCNIDKALAWLRPPYMREIDSSNRYIYESVKKYPDRILGFGWADPMIGVDRAKDAVKQCVYEYGLLGVKLNGAQNEYYIDDERLSMPVIEEIAKTGKPIAFHIGADAYERTHPFRLAKIAKRYPEMPILMVHMGGAGIPDLSEPCMEVALEHKNIMLIASATQDTALLKAITVLGSKRVCFGSDTPFRLMHAQLAMTKAVLDGENFTDEQKDDVLYGNIAAFLGVK